MTSLEMKDMQMKNNVEPRAGIVSRILKDVNKDDIQDSGILSRWKSHKIAENWSE